MAVIIKIIVVVIAVLASTISSVSGSIIPFTGTGGAATFASYALLATKKNNNGGKGKNEAKNVKKKEKAKPPDKKVSRGKDKNDSKMNDNNNNIFERMTETQQIGTYFVVWYLLNGVYSVLNKKMLQILDYPWTIATIQMSAGFVFVAPLLWLCGNRDVPTVSREDIEPLLPIALCHAIIHIGATAAAAAATAAASSSRAATVSSLSLAYFIKAWEPIVTYGVLYIVMQQHHGVLPEPLSQSVCVRLLFVIVGVVLGSLKNFTFTASTAATATLVTVSSAVRCVLAKIALSDNNTNALQVHTMYAIVTALATCLLLPAMFVLEGTGMMSAIKASVAAGDLSRLKVFGMFVLSGASYYAFNAAAFLALTKVHPVTHAVGNTVKRSVFLLLSLILYATPISVTTFLGSVMAIIGAVVYAKEMTSTTTIEKK